MKNPVIDLHCDLLTYLTRPNTTIYKTEDVGCAIPYLIEGKVVDEKNRPIKGAVIRGRSKEYIGVNTFSAADGSFTLYSNTPLVHFYVSASGKTLATIYKNLSFQPKEGLKDLSLKNEFLEYQTISYQQFLKDPKNENSSPFDFDEQLFNRYKFHADFGTVQLTTVDLYP